MNPKTYKHQAENIMNSFKDIKTVLEIGGGFGGLAKLLMNVYQEYTMVDNEKMLNLVRENDVKAELIDAKDIEVMKNRKFDLIISNHCLSETPPEYHNWVGVNIFPNCKNIFIIDDKTMEEYIQRYFDFEKKIYKEPNIFTYKGTRNEFIGSNS